jgi:SAM-dependent methyltransferase
VLDIGCGPGQVAGYLTARGVRAVGVDLSPNALSIARRRSAGSGFVAADMRRLPVRTGSCAGIVAFYSLHHLARKEVPAGLDELRRVAAPGATLLIATHEGEGEAFSEADWLGQHVEVMGATLFTADELDMALSEAAFTVDHILHRDPLPHEYQGPRVYVTATAVGSGD